MSPFRRAAPLRRLALGGAVSLLAGCAPSEPPPPPPRPAIARPPAIAKPAPPKPARAASRPPNGEKVRRGRALLAGGGREGRCGPYSLWSDSADARLLAACARIGSTLDAAFAARYGVRPEGEAAEGILLFADVADYRAYVKEEGRLAAGYAGFASEVDGLVVLHAGIPRAQAITTLAHELTHLTERRALGSSLPPWLAEGLADGIGYSASESGVGDLVGVRGVEGQVERLASAYRSGEAGSLERLAGLPRSRFDRGVRSFDYEQSSLLVRHLLLDPALRLRFRAYLARLGAGERYEAERFRNALDLSWAALDQGLRDWVERQAPRRRR